MSLREAVEVAQVMQVQWGVVANGASSMLSERLGKERGWVNAQLHGIETLGEGRGALVRGQIPTSTGAVWTELPMRVTGKAQVIIEYGDAESRRAAWGSYGPTWWAVEIDMLAAKAKDAADEVRDTRRRKEVVGLLAGGMFGSAVRSRRVLRPGRALSVEMWMVSGMGLSMAMVRSTTRDEMGGLARSRVLSMPPTARGARPDTSVFTYELAAGEVMFAASLSCASCHRVGRADLAHPKGGGPPKCRDRQECAGAVRAAVDSMKQSRREEVLEWEREEARRRQTHQDAAKRRREIEEEGRRLTYEGKQRMDLGGRIAESRQRTSVAVGERVAALVQSDGAAGSNGGAGESSTAGAVAGQGVAALRGIQRVAAMARVSAAAATEVATAVVTPTAGWRTVSSDDGGRGRGRGRWASPQASQGGGKGKGKGMMPPMDWAWNGKGKPMGGKGTMPPMAGAWQGKGKPMGRGWGAAWQ